MSEADRSAEIVARFAEMMRAVSALSSEEGGETAQKAVIDRIRDALDRQADRLRDDRPLLIANSFQLVDVIYRGERSEIWKLRHRDLQTTVAAKTVPVMLADDPIARSLLLREAEIGMSLYGREFLAARTVLRMADGRPLLIMDDAGTSLAETLRIRPLSRTAIGSLLQRLLASVGQLHDHHLAHCDISPANLFFDGNDINSLRIGDFGLTLRFGHRHGEFEIRHAGAPEFVSPRQRDGAPAAADFDLFAIGRLIDYLLDRCAISSDALRDLAATLCRSGVSSRSPADTRSAAALLGEAMKAV
jgi:type VI secretion system protein ImpN